MAIDSDLLTRLDRARADESFDVVIVLDAAAVESKVGLVEPLDVKAKRVAFARHAHEMLSDAIGHATKMSGARSTDVIFFDRTGSARVRAPVSLVQHLATHPSIASITMSSNKPE